MINYGTAMELLFPTRCAGCGEYAGRPLCPACNASMPLIGGPACIRCGTPYPHEVEECQVCRDRIKHLDATVALAVYEEPLRSVIHKLKYDNGWRLAPLLGAMVAVRLAPRLAGKQPLVTFVPMHRRKRRTRGYDHAEKLARGVGQALGLAVVTLLERTRYTQAQSALCHDGRRSNVEGAFRAVNGEAQGREVVLVDDVFTTGYTLCACARALKAAGAVKVTACVLARDMLGAA
ncbi:MAG: ComF family protein [Actinobacteria bacterium]|nr:ComF family protein [Actinomycetota bacterium]